MPDMLYVGLQEDNKIAVFAVDGDNGRLTRRADVAAAGGPSVTAISPDRNTLYVGCRERPSIASYRIDPATGGLSPLGTTAQTDGDRRKVGAHVLDDRRVQGIAPLRHFVLDPLSPIAGKAPNHRNSERRDRTGKTSGGKFR
jgi:6-phosphogluconolactonase (cycloisomerase 2 family)